MFPVSLEFKDGSFMTCDPPCYGFLRRDQWDEGDEYLVQGKHFYEGGSGSSSDDLDLSDVVAIWNTGTHLGVTDFDGEVTSVSNMYKDMVAAWSSSSGIELSMKDVMNHFESFIDKDSESCILWSDEGYMGVKTDTPCDRALFYLMLNRLFNYYHDGATVSYLLDLIYKRNFSPMVALFITRMVVPIKDAVGNSRFIWMGNDGDSCIFPISLTYKGIGKLYVKPTQINWHQHSYSEGYGHLRDEDLPDVLQTWEDIERWCSRSMFDAAFQQTYIVGDDGNPYLKDKEGNPVHSIAIDFAKEIFTERYFNYQLFGRYDQPRELGHFNYHRLSGGLMYPDEREFKRPRNDWEGIAISLILGE